MHNSKFPLISRELIQALEEKFPLSKSLTIETLDELRLYQGRQSVITFLKTTSEKQAKNGSIFNV